MVCSVVVVVTCGFVDLWVLTLTHPGKKYIPAVAKIQLMNVFMTPLYGILIQAPWGVTLRHFSSPCADCHWAEDPMVGECGRASYSVNAKAIDKKVLALLEVTERFAN